MNCLKCNGLFQYEKEKTESNFIIEYFKCVCCGLRIYNRPDDKK